uniref:Uncharacterized protein n=1 Tax=Panagrolaimus sp. JU765 TaxID=591449 RepID=A0AC34QZ82_9BILA
MSNKLKLLQCISDKLIDLEDQIRDLETIFNDFVNNQVGRTCLIVGPRLSGKTSLINHVCKMFGNRIMNRWIKTIDGRFYDDSDGTVLLKEIDDSDEMTVLIIDNFEQFAMRSRQQLLYTIMNQVCASKYLVLLTSCDFSCVERFEKRVRSRIAQRKITLPSDSSTSALAVLEELIMPFEWRPKKDEQVKRWRRICDSLDDSEFTSRELDRVAGMAFGNGIYRLKQLAMLLVSKFYDREDDIKFDDFIVEIAEVVAPKSSTIQDYLNQFEILELFLLEILRRLTEKLGERDIHQINIFRTFRRLFRKSNRKQKSKRIIFLFLANLRAKRVIEIKPGCEKAQLDFTKKSPKNNSSKDKHKMSDDDVSESKRKVAKKKPTTSPRPGKSPTPGKSPALSATQVTAPTQQTPTKKDEAEGDYIEFQFGNANVAKGLANAAAKKKQQESGAGSAKAPRKGPSKKNESDTVFGLLIPCLAQFDFRSWSSDGGTQREVIPPPPPPPNFRFIPFEPEPPRPQRWRPPVTRPPPPRPPTTIRTTTVPQTTESTTPPTTTTLPPSTVPTTPEICEPDNDSFLMRTLKERGLYNAIYMATDLYTASRTFPDLGDKTFTLTTSGKYECDEQCAAKSSVVRRVMHSDTRKSLVRSPQDIEVARARARVTEAPRAWWNDWRRDKREGQSDSEREKRSAADLAKINSGKTDGILGTTIALECDEATAESVPNTGYHLCRTCRAVRELPVQYFPRILNEVICAEGNCLRGDGKCTQRFLPFTILKDFGRPGCPQWREASVQIRTCCDCVIHPNSPFLKYVLD